MSIYDKASLVLIPSGSKTSKVYSQKPTNGDGDFTFSRSTAATRVNASGNIEKETQNLLEYSNTFSSWNLSNATISGGQSGYDGSSDAWIFTTSVAGAAVQQSFTSTGVLTFSVYAKAGSVNGIRLRIDTNSDANGYYDLVNGTAFLSAGIDASISDVGGGWYRCSLAHNVADPVKVQFFTTDGSTNYDNGSIYIQDAQLEQGLVARDYIETTTTAIYGGITDNVPRLDYQGSCPALLLEPQRTNLYTYSEYAGIWNKTLVNTTDNYAESPEGYNNAFRAEFTSNSGILYINGTGATGGDNTLSVWAKSNTGTDQVFRFFGNGNTIKSDNFTATTEWQRFTFTYNCTNVTSGLTGNSAGGSSDILFYGFQHEEGSYATSYIPTYGSAVTRNMDMAEIIPVSSSIIDTSLAHSGFIEIKSNGVDLSYQIFGIDDGSYNNFIKILQNSSQTNHRLYGRSNGGSYLTSSYGSSGQYNKYAWTYDGAGTLKYFLNGSLDSTHSVTFPTMSNVGYGERSGDTNYAAHSTNQILLFPTALTDQEAIDLTTL